MKLLTLVPIGGLANRMRTISSAIDFCKRNGRDLSVIWFLDHGLNCSFYDLFQPISIEGINVDIRDHSMLDLWIYDRPRLINLYIPYLFESFFFQKRIYDKESLDLFFQNSSLDVFKHYDRIYLASCVGGYPLSSNYEAFSPIPTLEKKINSISNGFDEYTIGIHIRRSDNIESAKKSPTELFIKKMVYELEKNNSVNFYLASDSIDEKQRLKSIFKKKLMTPFYTTQRNTKEGVQEALVELYTLSQTAQIIGSFSSSFSQTAALMSDIKFTTIQI